MTKFVRNSRLRRVVSTMCAVALIASLVVMPAGAAEDGAVTAFTPGSGLTAAEGVYYRGVQGNLAVSTVCTPAVQARQDSIRIFNSDAAKNMIMGPGSAANSLGVTETAGNFALKVAVYRGGVVATSVAITGVSFETSVGAAVARMNTIMSGLDSEIAANVFFTDDGRIRIRKKRAEAGSEIWAYSGSDPLDVNTDPAGLSLAEALFAGAETGWGRNSGPAGTYVAGSNNTTQSMVATWTPSFGNAITGIGGAFQYGSFVGGDMTARVFQAVPDTETGLYTAIRASGGADLTYLSYTAGRNNPVITGTSSAVFGNGLRDAAYDVNDGYNVVPTSGVATAGVTATWTVSVPAPDPTSGTWNAAENAYNGISILFPKDFQLVSDPSNPNFISDIGFGSSWNSTPTVATSATAEGYLVTLSNFVANGPLSFRVALKAPNKAGYVGGAKMWIHNVGTPWTANPSVTQLIDARYTDANADGIADTDWFPVFCDGTISMSTTPDLLNRVELTAERNRASGYTALVATAYDVHGNEVTNASNVTFGTPTVSGAADGAAIAARPGYKGQWVWKYAKTAGDNTVTLTVDDDRTTAVDFTAKTLTKSTLGITEPAKIVVIPTATGWTDGSTPSYQIELQDADGDPTCWLDEHSRSNQKYATRAYSHNFDTTDAKDRWIWRGWSRSSQFSGEMTSLIGTHQNAWPTPVMFSGSVDGADSWTITAKSLDGLALPATFATIDVSAEDPAIAGKPVGFKLVATKKAPAEFAVGDGVYNDKIHLGHMGVSDDAFGYAAAGGVETVKFEARVVDAYGNTVTNGTANIPVKFEIPVYPGYKGTFATGHVYETKTDANGVATVDMKSFEPQLTTRWISGTPTPFNGEYSWFTPVVASTSFFTSGSNWANPCGDSDAFDGYGFAYFHGAKMVDSELAQTPEGYDHDVVLADGTDASGLTVKFVDSAFNTPVANWDVKFTTSFGTFADGSKAATLTTDANGIASAPVKSAAAGVAFVRAFDRWLNSTTDSITFTDFATKFTVNEPTKRAGDRATAKVTAWAENIKTGQRVQFDDVDDVDYYYDEVFGYDAANSHGFGVNAPVWTNEVTLGNLIDTDNNGKEDAVELFVPAYDDSDIVLESAGKRYAYIGGQFTTSSWFNNVFYDEMTFAAAPARPEVDFVKEATLSAEGTQLDAGLNLVGVGFTPAHVSEQVEIYLGDITTHGRTQDNWVGYAYVGADGSLMPTAVFNGVGQIAPGEYDITVDGLVFKKGLVVKNLFNQAEIKLRDIAARNGDQLYINGAKNNTVQVDAFGALNTEVWMGGVKLANSASTGNFVIPAGKFSPGKYTVTAKVTWPTMRVNSPMYGGYTTVVKRDVYVQGPLKFATPALSASGRTLKVAGKVSGAAEWNGSKAFKVKVSYQRLVNGRWSTVATRYVNASATTGKFASSFKAGSAGTYRAVVSHKDLAHPASSKGSGSRSVR